MMKLIRKWWYVWRTWRVTPWMNWWYVRQIKREAARMQRRLNELKGSGQ